MKSKSGKEIIINDISYFHPFVNEKYEGFILGWDSNIGFGELTISKSHDNSGKDYHKIEFKDGDWEIQTECMSDNNDKEFIKLVLDKFIEKLNVIE